MNPMSSTIVFYFDYESPNAYLAWTQLPKLAKRYGFTVDPVPILDPRPAEMIRQDLAEWLASKAGR
jgi:2-hydroxychromene-2-carboxylate isomerase